MADAFAMADEVLHSGVRGITDLMVVPGLINLDFADVRTIMDEMGTAMMGTGEATGERRAIEAAETAITNPLLDDVSLKGPRGVLINITGGKDLTLYEVDEAASLIRGQVDQDANIIVGSALDDDLDGIVRVSVVATGVGPKAAAQQAPVRRNDLPLRAELERLEAEAETEAFAQEEDPFAIDDLELPHVPQEPAYAMEPQAAHTPQPAAPVIRPAIEPEYVREAQTVVKRPFGFFGRKKSIPVATTPPTVQPRNTGDLFSDDADDELEIPSFLRRQS